VYCIVTQLETREEEAMIVLLSLETEMNVLQQTYQELNRELRDLEAQEFRFWNELNTKEMASKEYLEQIESMNIQYELAKERLELLKSTNVYNDAFKIWHDGPFGTINGLRLGKLASKSVDWAEINAGIGQMALLIECLAQKMKFTFRQYRIIAMGSSSKIEKLDGDKAVYELYGSNDFTGMLLFSNRRFDMGLVALLGCLKEFADHLEAQDSTFRLPYRYLYLTRIAKDRIGDCSIKLQFNQEENWTKALKYLLIDLKWLMAFCAS
jgi:beclin 1